MQIAFSKIIYLTGPISSEPDYKRVFALAHRLFAYEGYAVINPAKIVLNWADAMPENECWAGYLCYDLNILRHIADHAIMVRLPNWGRSKGSCLEQAFAYQHHIPVKNVWDFIPDFKELLEAELAKGKEHAT